MSAKESSQGSDAFKPIIRHRGCWNCTHWDNQEKAQNFWGVRRRADLNTAFLETKINPLGENAPKVISIRRTVDQVDHAVASGVFGVCLKGKAEADLVHNAYLCDGWTGKEGSSLSTSATTPDLLPEELKAEREDKLK